MSTADPRDELKALDATLSSIEQVLDVPALRRQVTELEAQAAVPDLWNDPEEAQRITSKLSHAQNDVRRVEGLRSRLDDAAVLLDLADSEEDAGVHVEALAEIAALTKAIGELEVRTLLSGQ